MQMDDSIPSEHQRWGGGNVLNRKKQGEMEKYSKCRDEKRTERYDEGRDMNSLAAMPPLCISQ